VRTPGLSAQAVRNRRDGAVHAINSSPREGGPSQRCAALGRNAPLQIPDIQREGRCRQHSSGRPPEARLVLTRMRGEACLPWS